MSNRKVKPRRWSFVFKAKRNQHLGWNASKLLENEKGVWYWAAVCVNVAFGPDRKGLWTKGMHSSHVQPLQATSHQGFTPAVSAAVAFVSFTTWSMGIALCVGSWKVQSFLPSFCGDRVLQMALWYVWMHLHYLKYIIYTNTEFLVPFYGQICSQCNLNAIKCKKFFFCYLFWNRICRPLVAIVLEGQKVHWATVWL